MRRRIAVITARADASEQRWYAFSVAKATKFTAAMVMDDTADFDLYVRSEEHTSELQSR